jgi:ubiquinone/menaquinone biosynthesis C-methylase UbiE/dienelactone hydrolase
MGTAVVSPKISRGKINRNFRSKGISVWPLSFRHLRKLPETQYAQLVDLVTRFSHLNIKRIIVPKFIDPDKINFDSFSDEAVLESTRLVRLGEGRVLDLGKLMRVQAEINKQRELARLDFSVPRPRIEKAELLFSGTAEQRFLQLIDLIPGKRKFFNALVQDRKATVEDVIRKIEKDRAELGFLNAVVTYPNPDDIKAGVPADQIRWIRSEETRRPDIGYSGYDPGVGGKVPDYTVKSVIENKSREVLFFVDIAKGKENSFLDQDLVISPTRDADLEHYVGPTEMIFVRLMAHGKTVAVVHLHNRTHARTNALSVDFLPGNKGDKRRFLTAIETYFRGANWAIGEITRRELDGVSRIVGLKPERETTIQLPGIMEVVRPQSVQAEAAAQPILKGSRKRKKKIGLSSIVTFLLYFYYKKKIAFLNWWGRIWSSAGKQQRINLVEYKNADGEKIVAIVDYPNLKKGQRGKQVPWIIIPPAYGKRKETYFMLALYLKENGFGVIRYDDSCGPGESEGDIKNTTLSRSALNITATLDYVSHKLKAKKIGMIPFSLSARPALKIAAADKRIDFLMPVVGAPNIESLLDRVYGENLIEGYQKGARKELLNVLGFFIDSDNFLGDAVEQKFADLASAKEDMRKLSVPVVWFCGEMDPWVNQAQVDELIAVNPAGSFREKIVVPGLTHRFREAKKAHEVFTQVVRKTREVFFGDSGFKVKSPSTGEVFERGVRERSRIEVQISREQEIRRWATYLEGFDILAKTNEYMDYMRTLFRLIDFRPGERVADIGCGTGNFAEYWAAELTKDILGGEVKDRVPGAIVGLDIVDLALQKAKSKLDEKRAKCARLPEGAFHGLDLDISYLEIIELLSSGEIELEGLNDIPGMDLDSGAIHDRGKVRRYIRGELPLDMVDLIRVAGEKNAPYLIEVDLASRFLRQDLKLADLNEEGRKKGLDYNALNCSDLNFELLKPGESGLNTSLPIADGSFDKVLASLLFSYLHNPQGTLRELKRIVKKDGTVILTSLKPDADISQIYARFLDKLRSEYPADQQQEILAQARSLFNEAVGWIEVEEESGRFKYYSGEELRRMLEENGFVDVKIYRSFGDQAVIAVGRRAH